MWTRDELNNCGARSTLMESVLIISPLLAVVAQPHIYIYALIRNHKCSDLYIYICIYIKYVYMRKFETFCTSQDLTSLKSFCPFSLFSRVSFIVVTFLVIILNCSWFGAIAYKTYKMHMVLNYCVSVFTSLIVYGLNKFNYLYILF